MIGRAHPKYDRATNCFFLLSVTKERTRKMFMRATSSLAAPLLALAIATAPGLSVPQDDKYVNASGSTYHAENSVSGPAVGHVKVMQVISDKGFTNEDLVGILPLLQDLRDARTECDSKHSAIYTDLVLTRGDKAAAEASVRDCERVLADRQRNIWNTISDKVGADKANALRATVEPMTEDVSKYAYTSPRLQRIETMLVELDRMAAARIAANGGTPDQSGVVPASVVTVTTVTTRVEPAIPITVTTAPIVSERDLVDIIEEKIVANEIGHSEYMIFIPTYRDLKTTDVTFLREQNLKVWW